jgi:hypothetical protein
VAIMTKKLQIKDILWKHIEYQLQDRYKTGSYDIKTELDFKMFSIVWMCLGREVNSHIRGRND